jgi:fatty-acid peroxygenase
MNAIPRDEAVDSSLAFKAEGYDYIGNRCRRFGSDIFEARLLGRRWYCVRGAAAARMFYVPGRFTRRGGLPLSALRLLQDEGSVAVLDGDAHRERKALLMSLMRPPRLEDIARHAAEELRARSRSWREDVALHGEFRAVLCRAVCGWAGVPLEEGDAERLTRELGDMIDNAGRIGPANWAARVERWSTERFIRKLVEHVRDGRLAPPAESALHVIAGYRGAERAMLPTEICAVELINILRPTVAIARFMTFAALALHRHPAWRDRLREDDSLLEPFVHEVRRTTPFFPAVAGVARGPFEWNGHRFQEGDRFILDLYGTDRDAGSWDEPGAFRPERFIGWSGDAFSMIPQGGGDHFENHRCAGEWLTVAVMVAMLRVLVREIDYDVPPQDLSVDLSEMPALPKSGFVIRPSPAAFSG